MESEECPRCKSTKYRNPKMKLMINLCAHPLCETCVEQVFVRNVADCPTCAKSLKKADYRIQIFEDTYIEKEIAIRRKILKDFKETEKDFLSLKEFNDYLEKIETFIFNLANNIDEEKTKTSIDEYKKEIKSKTTSKRPETQSKEISTYVYKPYIMSLEGPTLPVDKTLYELYTPHVQPTITNHYKAGGFLSLVPVRKQLQEAFSGLFISTKADSS